MGTKHRGEMAQLLPVPENGGYPDTPQGRIQYMVRCGLNRLWESFDRNPKADCDRGMFEQYADEVEGKVKEFTDSLTEAELRPLRSPES